MRQDRYVFEQGHALGREGIVYVEVDEGVWVGGDAVLVLRGTLARQTKKINSS